MLPRKRLLGLGLALLVASCTAATLPSPSPPVFRSVSSQFTLLEPLSPVPDTPIRALDGAVTNLHRFRGKVVVLNFWATWCLPCIYEMPTLDRLAAKRDARRLAVLAVSIDRNGGSAVVPFIEAHNLTHLPIYLDPDQRLGSFTSDHVAAGALPLWGLPITYIIDKEGRVAGYLTGAATWDSPEAKKFLDYFLQETTSYRSDYQDIRRSPTSIGINGTHHFMAFSP